MKFRFLNKETRKLLLLAVIDIKNLTPVRVRESTHILSQPLGQIRKSRTAKNRNFLVPLVKIPYLTQGWYRTRAFFRKKWTQMNKAGG